MIRLLDKTVANKIAAGEVVDKPLSIVKELVENSIDAGANNIIVEIKNGGKSYIRVSDNGCGIPAEEISLAFKRHATSKIEKASDLDSIETLGFRGEALASIAAVTRTEIITKTEDERMGTNVFIEGGHTIEEKPVGSDRGTTLIIRDLFFNTPARFKFLKSDAAETNAINDFISQIALAYSNIKFRFISNGNILFSTQGKGNVLSHIAAIYGNDTGKNLIHVTEETGGMKLDAYISNAGETRSTRRSQIFFVNGRSIASKIMSEAVREAYLERVPSGRFPIAFIFLTVDPSTLDVNIHPNKREVRFDNDKLVENFIFSSLKKALLTEESIPAVKEKDIFSLNRGIKKSLREDVQLDASTLISPAPEKTAPAPETAPAQAQKKDYHITETPETHQHEEMPAAVKEVSYSEKKRDLGNELASLRNSINRQTSEPDSVETKNIESSPEASKEPFEFTGLSIIGTLFQTYILGELDETFYLIDQHAAHERVFFEKFSKNFSEQSGDGQTIIIPVIYNCSSTVAAMAPQWIEALEKTGYKIEEFGIQTYRITEIPAFMEIEEAEKFLKDFAESIDENFNCNNQDMIDRIATRACKSAVKAHDNLSLAEIRALINELSQCDNPFSCPHGRPVFIKMSKYQIERMFKRA